MTSRGRAADLWTPDPPNANAYEVRELGDTWAVTRESTSGSPFWLVARYDWSDPDVVRWTVVESSYGGGGEGVVRADPSGRGGSRVHVEWTSTGARGWQKPIVIVLHHGPASRLFARMWVSTFDRYARTDPA